MRALYRFTLIELLVALALAAIVLSTLFYFYRQTILLERKADAGQAQAFRELYFESRLKEVLSHAKRPEKTTPFLLAFDNSDVFQTGSPNLLFAFDNGVKENKPFSYFVIGRLYLDKGKRLILAVWPQPKWWKVGEIPPMKQEVLLEQVEKLHFRCFIPLFKGLEGKLKTLPAELYGQWVDKWERHYEQLPALIEVKLELVGEEKPLVIVAHLLNCLQPITYDHI